MKKFLSIVMVVVIAFTVVPLSVIASIDLGIKVSALASNGMCGSNVSYTYNSSSKEVVISGAGYMYANYSYDDSPFAFSDITSVVIEDGVKSIGQYLFYGCRHLESVTIGTNVESIGFEAFQFCLSIKNFNVDDDNNYYSSVDGVLFNDKKTTLVAYPIGNIRSSYSIPDGVINIKSSAFQFCENLESLIIPNSVQSIGSYAFWECENLKNIWMGNSVATIGEMAFIACVNLLSINVDVKNSIYYSADGVLFDRVKKELVQYPVGNLSTTYTIPNDIYRVGEWAFRACRSLTSITIPDSVVSIGEYAFYDCKNISNVYYYGNKNQWKNIAVDLENYYLTNATIHYHYGKPHVYIESVANPTCTTQGFTTYTCECGDTYVDDYKDANGHSYTSEVTTYATHLAEGVETFTCHCGDTYTKAIQKITDHKHNAVTTDPTCTDQGFTTYTCECGDSYVADYVKENGHSFTNYISDGKATCVTDGSLIAKCDNCDKTDAKPEKGGHNFSTDFTIDLDPTCTSEGQKSRHCLNCTEKTDVTVIGKLVHTYSSVITAPTCTAQGYTTYTCSCGDTYKGDYIDKLEHSYNVTTIAPKCTEKGYNVYTCSCGDNYTETIEATGHSFSGSACVNCNYDKADTCFCNCHKSGIANLIFKIMLFFQRLFRTNGECVCGERHY